MGDDATGRRVIFEEVEGGLRLTLNEYSREVVMHLLRELRGEITAAKAAAHDELPEHMKRLFPTGYHADAKRNEEFRRLTHSDLADSHLAAIDHAVELLSPDRVFDATELERFVRAINAMRLVLGTLLDVSEDDERDAQAEAEAGSDDDTAVTQREVYDYLGWLLHTCLDRLSGH